MVGENQFGQFGANKVFKSQVTGATRHPVLLLEKHDHAIDSVECNGKSNTISVTFADPQSLQETREQKLKGATVITSHFGCNEDDERRPFRIDSFSVDEDNSRLDLHVSKRNFKEVFRSASVEYLDTYEPHILRRNVPQERARLARAKRDDASSTWQYPTMSLSAGLPAGTPGADSGQTDLSWSVKDEGFTLPSAVTDHLMASLEVGCNDCSQEGTLSFTQGKFEFDFDIDVDWSEGDFDVQVFKGGWINLALNDYKLHMDMYAIPSGSVYFFKPLVDIPFPGAGFKIPGFGKVGLFFTPGLMGSISLTVPMKFNYGFDVTIPDSHVRVDFGNIDGEIEGFTDAQVEALPFTSNETDPSLSVVGMFIPRIPLAFEFGVPTDDEGSNLPSGGVRAEVGVFVQTPRIQYDFTVGCGGAGNSTALALRDEGTLIKMSPHIEINGGFDLMAWVRIEGTNPGFFTRTVLVSTAWPLPTACYSVNLEEGTWSEVTPTSAPAIRARAIDSPRSAKAMVTPPPQARKVAFSN
jgi:hypothetical protein